MRVWDIAVFMMVVQIVGGILTSGGFFALMGFDADIIIIHDNNDAQIQAAQDELADITADADTSSGTSLETAFGMMYNWVMAAITAIVNAANPIIKFVAWMPLLMIQAGIPAAFAWGIFTIYVALESVAFLQLIAGRNLKEYD